MLPSAQQAKLEEQPNSVSLEKEGESEAPKPAALGAPTQGLLRLPKLSPPSLVEEGEAQDKDQLVVDTVPKKREFKLGSVEAVRRTGISRSSDEWLEAANRAKASLTKSDNPSLPLEVVAADSKDSSTKDSIHITPSFEFLAEKMEHIEANVSKNPKPFTVSSYRTVCMLSSFNFCILLLHRTLLQLKQTQRHAFKRSFWISLEQNSLSF